MPFDDVPGGARPVPGELIVATMMRDGVDVDDRQAVDAWIRAFNQKSVDERDRVLPTSLLDEIEEEERDEGVRPTARIIVVLPDESDARASAARSPLLGHVRTLVDFLGDGRKATTKGNVTLADARRLVPLLDTGDVFDPTIAGRTSKTRVADRLPGLLRIVRLAEGAGFVEHVDGKLVPTDGSRGLGDPLADLGRITEAVNRIGMVSSRHPVDRFGNDEALWMDDRFGPMLAFLLDHPVGEATPFEELVERTFVQLWHDEWMGSLYGTGARAREAARRGISTAVETLDLAGLVSWSGAGFELDSSGMRRPRSGGTVALTPGGRWTVTAELVDVLRWPITIAGVPELTDLDFADLVGRTRAGPDDAAQFAVEVRAWLDRHGDDALALLVSAARSTDDVAVRVITLGVISERFADQAERVVRTLLDDRDARGAALVWLVDRDHEAPESLLDPDPAVFADVLALELERDGATAMLDVFAHVGDADAQVATLDGLWREPHPGMATVLAALGRAHPTEAVAKAARKAALRHQTMLASPGG